MNYLNKCRKLCCSVLCALTAWLAAAEGSPNLPVKPSKDKAEAWGSPVNGVRMSLQLAASTNVLNINSPLDIVVRYENRSTDETFMFFAMHSFPDSGSVQFEVISPSGKPIMEHPKKKQRAPNDGSFVILRPGVSHKINANLSGLFSFKELGTYKITAAQTLSGSIKRNGEIKPFQIISNPLEVTVVSTGSDMQRR